MPCSLSDERRDFEHKKSSKDIKKRKRLHKKRKNLPSEHVRRQVFPFLCTMTDFEEKACACALNRIFGFTPRTGTALISHLGSASEVFRLSDDELKDLLGRDSRHSELIGAEAVRAARIELKEMENLGVGFIPWHSPEYPSLLKECPDPPIGLYIRSTTPPQELWNPSRSIAVVGTRDITPYGKEWCERTVMALAGAQEKPLIISGLALGTDICAHRTAIDNGLPTIGVMATGPETIYPHRHKEFAGKLSRTPGCALITDYPPGTAPLAIHFLRRNRIIAGLADATILIESKARGGGMTTARLAFSYSRDVYALPGRADDIRSQGCNRLIREKVAEPLISIEDMADALGLRQSCVKRNNSTAEILKSHFGKLYPAEQMADMGKILDAIRKEKGITIEEIALKTGIEYMKTSRIAGFLEMEGLICIDLLQRCTLETKIFR